jgi:cytochrome c
MKMKSAVLPLALVSTIVIGGCGEDGKRNRGDNEVFYDGEKIAVNKCSSCHNLDIPPKTDSNETAPPMFAVAVHLKDWMAKKDPNGVRERFVSFVSDYVLEPSREKSYCDPASLDTYGVMPSQKGLVTRDELTAVAGWIYDTFDQKALMEEMKRRIYLKSLPPYRQVLETEDCKMCHISGGGKVAPKFEKIGERYAEKGGIEAISKSIREGSRGKWKGYTAPMRAYKDIDDKRLEAISRWILEQGKKAGEKQ